MVRVSPKRSIRKTLWTLLFGFSTIILFQNCSDLNNAEMVSIDTVVQEHLRNLPFAFDVELDQISYMSCSGQYAAGHPNAYTFKAGAFFPGSGLRLRNNFMSNISNLNTDVQAHSLRLSNRNAEAGAVLSIRERNYLQDYIDPQANKGEIPMSRLMFNESTGRHFSSEHYARRLLAMGTGNYMNYISGLPGFLHKSFDGTIRIADSSGTADSLRNLMANSHYLTVTFPEPVGSQTSGKRHGLARSPHNTMSGDQQALTSVFGRGYALSFQQFDGRMPTVPARILSVNNTVNLENQSIVSDNWDCSERFVIVRPEDAKRLTYDPTPDTNATPAESLENREVCEMNSDPIPANVEEQKRLERIRNILPVESWYVTLPRTIVEAGVTYTKPGCIVPKGNDFCYDMREETGGVNNPNFRIAYYYEEDTSSTEWGHSVEGINYEGRCGAGTLFVCPHYVTICHKN